ncbi:MAG: excinuclease ABC subunit UvrC [bacterium]
MDHLRSKIDALPESPGVYIFKDSTGKVIYVGKARSLRARVRSYLGSPEGVSPRVAAIVKKVHDLDFIVTASEVEALILECAQIKHFKPRYNVRLKDDKKYPYIKVTMNEPYPSIYPTRNVVKDGSRYFGPYTDARAMRRSLGFLSQVFQIRTCRKRLPLARPDRGCLKFFIRRCMGACRGQISIDEYRKVVESACAFLSGRVSDLTRDLREKMARASAEKRFEDAARIRDMIKAIEKVSERQVVVGTSEADRDVVVVRRGEREAVGLIIRIREGKLLSKEVHRLGFDGQPSEDEILTSFLEQYFAAADPLPSEVLVERIPQGVELIEELMTSKTSRKIRVLCPKAGKARKIVDLAIRNAEVMISQTASVGGRKTIPHSLNELRRWIGMDKPPSLIMAFDISTLQGADSVGARVAFKDAKPLKCLYRRYKIRGVVGQDDFAMIREVVNRSWSHAKSGEEPVPDLIVVDGGKGQVTSAIKGLVESGSGVEDIPKVIGISKPIDEIWLAEKPEPIQIPHGSSALRLLMRIRDEVHRFAIGYHRKRRERRVKSSILEEIPGIGPKLSLRLLERFGSLEGIKDKPVEQIASVPGIGPSKAVTILKHLGKEVQPR